MANTPEVPLYRAICPYQGKGDDDLTFTTNDIIAVSDTGASKTSWWYGSCNGIEGSFPGTYVVPYVKPAPLSKPILKNAAAAPKAKGRRITFFENIKVVYVDTAQVYDRKGEFNPNRARVEWETEQEEEQIRQLHDRWEYLERDAPGVPCEERALFEANVAAMQRAQQQLEDEASARRQDRKKETRGPVIH